MCLAADALICVSEARDIWTRPWMTKRLDTTDHRTDVPQLRVIFGDYYESRDKLFGPIVM